MAVKEKRMLITTIASKFAPRDHIVIDGASYEVHEVRVESRSDSGKKITFFGHRVGVPRHNIKWVMNPDQEIILSRVMVDPAGIADFEKQDASDVWVGTYLPRARETLLYSGIPCRVLWSRQSKCWNHVDNEIQLLIEFNEGEPAELINIKGIAHNLQTFSNQKSALSDLAKDLEHYRKRINDNVFIDKLLSPTLDKIARLANLAGKD